MIVRVVANLNDPYNRRVLPGAAEFARLKGWELEIYNLNFASKLVDSVHGAQALLLGVHSYEHDPLFMRTQLPAVTWSGSS